MRVIIITGGVLSGIGKGITGASIGALLKSAGYSIFMQKFDGYLNVDAGTINPFKHGECFVTEDGVETDLDIGHYERYLDANMNEMSIFTTGKLMKEIMSRERKGDYLGHDVQIVPHFTNLIKEKIKLGFESSGADISIIEVGGTIGDVENEAIVESMRQLRQDLGYHHVVYVHLGYIPFLLASKELKTKPIQNSVKDLRMRGIIPDFLICRADQDISYDIIKKIAYMTGIQEDHVIPAPTVDTIYRIPLEYKNYQIGSHILQHLQLPYNSFDLSKRVDLYDHITHSTTELHIAMIGKYIHLEDSYYSLNEGLKIAGFYHHHKVKLIFIEAEELTTENIADRLVGIAGICIPGGFGSRGIEGMLLAIEFARVHTIPYLGVCLGAQLMVIEFARNVLGYTDATSEEFDSDHISHNHIVHTMDSQRSLIDKGGTMRLGSYQCILKEGTKVMSIYKDSSVFERHRHRFEFNNSYRMEFEEHGCIISGSSPDGKLAEMIELADHPFMIATQAHPEFKARPTNPHPLLTSFIQACIHYSTLL